MKFIKIQTVGKPPKLSETWKEDIANTNREAVLKTCESNSKLLVFLKFILAVYNV